MELHNSFDTKEYTTVRHDTISFLLCKTDENNSKLPKPLENNAGKWVWRVYKQHKNLICRSSLKFKTLVLNFNERPPFGFYPIQCV